MGRRRTPVPAGLNGSAVRAAEAALWGVSPRRRRHDDVRSPFHGVMAVRADDTTVLGLCRIYEAARLPGQFYSHATAAVLYGIPLPGSAQPLPLHVSVQAPRTAPRRTGVIGHSLQVAELVLARVHGLPVARPADVWCQLAAELDPHDLVAAGDFLISGGRTSAGRAAPLATLEDLEDAARRHSGCRGAKAIRWALPRLRAGVDSPPESHLRLVLVAGGLPEPVVAHPIRVEGGRTLHPDLAYPAQRVLLEYEGDGHRTDAGQWRRDITRREMLEAAGWRVIRVTADDLYRDRPALIARVRRALARS